MSATESRLPLTIFCGKGGVGKTTLSLAYGLQQALAGRTALVITSHPLEELAVSVSLAGLREKYPEAATKLFIIHVDPRDVLAGIVKEHIPTRLLADAVVSSRIYHSLIEVAPGLKEMVFLGRLQQLAEQRAEETKKHQYDLVVWDAPATGHFLQTLQASRHFDLYLSGPFSVMGKEVSQFFSNRERLAVIPVSTPEEMAVEETIELAAGLGKLSMVPREVICNLASPMLELSEAEREQCEQEIQEQQARAPGLEFLRERLRLERELYRQLRTAVSAETHIVQGGHRRQTDLDLLVELAGRMNLNGDGSATIGRAARAAKQRKH